MSLTIDINFIDADWEEQKHPRGKSGEHGGQFVSKGGEGASATSSTTSVPAKPKKPAAEQPTELVNSVGVTITYATARKMGSQPQIHSTENLEIALKLLKPSNLNKIDRDHRKAITAELVKRKLQPGAATQAPAVQPKPAAPAAPAPPAAPKVTGDPKTDEASYQQLVKLQGEKYKKLMDSGWSKEAAEEFDAANSQLEDFEKAMKAAGQQPPSALKNDLPKPEPEKPLPSKPTGNAVTEEGEKKKWGAGDIFNLQTGAASNLSEYGGLLGISNKFLAATGLANNADEYAKKLPEATVSALRNYSGAIYRPINQGLREGQPLSEEKQIVTDSIDEWLHNPESRTKKPFKAYRGVELPKAQWDAIQRVANGERSDVTIYNPGYSSTSLDLQIARNFAKGKAIMEITVRPGTPVAYMAACCSGIGHELEALLPRGVPMKVTGVRQQGAQQIIEVTV